MKIVIFLVVVVGCCSFFTLGCRAQTSADVYQHERTRVETRTYYGGLETRYYAHYSRSTAGTRKYPRGYDQPIVGPRKVVWHTREPLIKVRAYDPFGGSHRTGSKEVRVVKETHIHLDKPLVKVNLFRNDY